MKWPWQTKNLSIDQVLQRIEALTTTVSKINVTPENCERSPTVKAIVTAISRRISVSPVAVYQQSMQDGKKVKIAQPDHPVTQLLNRPNNWQSGNEFWLDMTSQLVRHGNAFCWKGAGRSGPVRRLIPLHSANTRGEFDENLNVIYRTGAYPGEARIPEEYAWDQIFHSRGASRDFLNGVSPVRDIREAIGLEIAAEQFGATFFGNGAMPMLVFQLMDGFKEWKTTEEKDKFLAGIKDKLTGGNRHKALFMPKGVELADKDKYSFDMDKVQFVDGRKYQRTVIAGGFGVPPNYVGDLERATYNNVEQQTIGFTTDVVLPHVQMFESAAERDLLTEQDRQNGMIVRFDLDEIQRADFKSRQEGKQIQRLNGVLSANEWREGENMNPISAEDGGDDYWKPMNYELPGEEADETSTGDDDADGNNATL